MKPRVWISEIHFNDKTRIFLSENEIIVFVGPNNSGKSATLKELAGLLKQKSNTGRVILDIEIEKLGSEEELLSLLKKSSISLKENDNVHYKGLGYNFLEYSAKSDWKNHKNGINHIISVFVNTLTTEQRLQIANPPKNINLSTEPFVHPIHVLQDEDSEEKKFSEYFRQAFGIDLLVDRNAGGIVPLYVGNKPTPNPGEDRISKNYLKELRKLDLLHLQGDGMRSFVGVLLSSFINSIHSVLFIDEPEAFLHPPQARLLGKMLAKDLPSEKQLFLATHSEDFLKGLLDANVSCLKIIRIQRESNINHVSIINSTDINNIWSDSLLRHSNILNGLFHTKVVICESDSDCRFFSAILSSLYHDKTDIAPDIMFTHCGGKQRLPLAIKALSKLNVPIKVISDFDVLNDISPLKEIFEGLGGSWIEVENDWKLVKQEIEQRRPEFLTSDLKKELEYIIENITERIFPNNKIIEIQKALKKASPWKEAKGVGKAYIPAGNATQSFERIQLKFKERGLLILEVGELESFVKKIGNHGPKWVSEVLTLDLQTDSDLESAKRFILENIV